MPKTSKTEVLQMFSALEANLNQGVRMVFFSTQNFVFEKMIFEQFLRVFEKVGIWNKTLNLMTKFLTEGTNKEGK